jgi:hypothetical protein
MRSVGCIWFKSLNQTFATDYRDELSRTAHATQNGYTGCVL